MSDEFEAVRWCAGTYKVILGDCIEAMRGMEAERVHTCVTSPPYFGLRDYGCEGQIGLEETPDAFVAKMVEVFREVRRVLRDDGTLWLNLGDTYASNGGPGWQGKNGLRSDRRFTASRNTVGMREQARTAFTDFKPKDLIGIPWRVAFALQADGWFLRQDIIWSKPNPIPESVKDRCTKAHEYLFLLSKSERYYFDHEAIREGAKYGRRTNPNALPKTGRKKQNSSIWRGCGDAVNPVERGADQSKATYDPSTGRNRRSVWTVTTKPYKGAHFATFPPDLIEPCILAGAPPGGTVLDPFGGTGTTAGVAIKNGRHAILCELNPEYAAFVPERIKQIATDQRDLLREAAT